MPRSLRSCDVQPGLSDHQKACIRRRFTRTMSDRFDADGLALAMFMLDALVLSAPTAAAASAGMTDLMRVLSAG